MEPQPPPSAIELTADTALHLVEGIRTSSDASGHVLVDTPVGTVVDLGPDGYALLAMFSQPRTLGEAMDELETRLGGKPGFISTAGGIMALIETGVLAHETEGGLPNGWADPVEQARMLHDHRRTTSFLEAIRAAVRPGDVVLDIGTGSGVLAVAAAKAGARHVYAIEASDIGTVAQRVFDANRVHDRVTMIPGWSAQVDLPERADVLVAEIIGSEPLEEEILETTLDARRRLLRPGARLIPHAIQLLARPLQVPEADRRYRTIGSDAVADWRTRYGIDFHPLLQAARSDPAHWPTRSERVATWKRLGPPTVLVSIDLGTFGSLEVVAGADLALECDGRVDAIAVTFKADLHGDASLATDPWIWPTSSWSTSVWFLPEPIQAHRGAVLRVDYRRRVPGQADGLSCVVATSVRRSRITPGQFGVSPT